MVCTKCGSTRGNAATCPWNPKCGQPDPSKHNKSPRAKGKSNGAHGTATMSKPKTTLRPVPSKPGPPVLKSKPKPKPKPVTPKPVTPKSKPKPMTLKFKPKPVTPKSKPKSVTPKFKPKPVTPKPGAAAASVSPGITSADIEGIRAYARQAFPGNRAMQDEYFADTIKLQFALPPAHDEVSEAHRRKVAAGKAKRAIIKDACDICYKRLTLNLTWERIFTTPVFSFFLGCGKAIKMRLPIVLSVRHTSVIYHW